MTLTENLPREDAGVSKRVCEAADKLERHIQLSGLKAGDRYITAKEAAKLLGKSVMTAQRAMTLLAQRNLLDRRPKAGTFISEAAMPKADLKCIHILVPEQFTDEEQSGESYWDRVHAEISGLKTVLPHLSIQFNFIPHQEVGYAQQIVDKAYKAGSLSGVILGLSSRAMRAYFNESGIPTVVEGSSEADLENLCWLTWDQKQSGRLLANHLLQRGHSRLATVMRDVWSVGEHLLHDGIGEAIAEAGLSNALRVRSTPPDHSATMEIVRSLLSEGEGSPTGIICRNHFQADCVSQVAAHLGLGNQVEVVLCNAPFSNHEIKYTCLVPEISGMEQGKIMGKMFCDLMAHKMPATKGYTVGVRLQHANQPTIIL